MKKRQVQEAEYIALAQDGDVEAFGQLVESYKERVYMLVLQMTHNRADADDLSQQAFLQAYQSLKKFQGHSSFFTWIYRITVNLCLTHLKTQKRWQPLPQPDDGDEPSAPEFGTYDALGKDVEEQDTRRQVWAALDQLGAELRAAVVLVYLQDLTPREAAVSLGCAEATVHWRLFKARKILKGILR